MIAVSELLKRMAVTDQGRTAATYRNGNAVYMKMLNYRRLDPAFLAAGKVGLSRGNQLEEEIWHEYSNARHRLRAVANAIQRGVAELERLPDHEPGVSEISEATEGRILTVLHRRRERNRRLVEQRKAKAIKTTGTLRCEVCAFEFGHHYGERGIGFIECHHTLPLAAMADGGKTRLEDLALLCANCHRMIHLLRPWLSLDELRAIVKAAAMTAAGGAGGPT